MWTRELFLKAEYIDRIGPKSVSTLKFVIAWNYVVLFDKIHMKTVNSNVSHHRYIIQFCISVLLGYYENDGILKHDCKVWEVNIF